MTAFCYTDFSDHIEIVIIIILNYYNELFKGSFDFVVQFLDSEWSEKKLWFYNDDYFFFSGDTLRYT